MLLIFQGNWECSWLDDSNVGLNRQSELSLPLRYYTAAHLKLIAKTMEYVTNLLVDVLRGIVNHPDSIKVSSADMVDEKRGEYTLITVRVHNEDVGLCVGKFGMMAECLRYLFRVIGTLKAQKKVYLIIDAPWNAKKFSAQSSRPESRNQSLINRFKESNTSDGIDFNL